MGMCPLFQGSFFLPGLGPFGGPCVALLGVCVCPLFQGSFFLPGLGPFGGPSVALLEGCVCVSFVSVFFLLARVGAIWWPLCRSA